MSKTTKVIAALGVVTGLGVAALPLGAVGATGLQSGASPQSDGITVSTVVGGGVSLLLSTGTVTGGNITAGAAATTTTDALTVTAASNGAFKTVAYGTNAEATGEGQLASDLTMDTSNQIHYSTAATPAADTSYWQMKTHNDGGIIALDGAVSGTTVTGTPIAGLSSNSISDVIDFTFAAGTEQASGTYTGAVTFVVATAS